MNVLAILLLFAASASRLQAPVEDNRTAPKFPIVKPERGWLNSPPLKMADLRGKVIMLDVWTFLCWNCTNSIPWIREMQSRFDQEDFLVIGIHSPEFEREKDLEAVKAAVAKHKLTFPQYIDNDFAYWRALNNRYWPAFYLVDKKGQVRHVAVGEIHVGDRRDREIQQIVEKLLKE
jgi:hypothetical protein